MVTSRFRVWAHGVPRGSGLGSGSASKIDLRAQGVTQGPGLGSTELLKVRF